MSRSRAAVTGRPRPHLRRVVGAGLSTWVLLLAACGRPVPDPVVQSGTGPEPTAPAAEVPFPELPEWAGRAPGLNPDAEIAANRALRERLPLVTGAELVEVTDHYVYTADENDHTTDENDHSIATGVETTWTYRIENHSKCDLADRIEAPLVRAGWAQFTLETAGSDPASATRHSEFFDPPGYAVVVVDSPPTRFHLRVQAHSNRLPPRSEPTGEPMPSPFVPCRPDPPPSPPDPPADRDAALAENAAIFSTLPLPAGAAVFEHFPESATAMGNGGAPIGYGSAWRLHLPSGSDLCAVASDFDRVMGDAGWERFTEEHSGSRTSIYYSPPQSVEATLLNEGLLHVLVMGNGAVVGTRQHPGGPAGFVAGATPETRGVPVPCGLTPPDGARAVKH